MSLLNDDNREIVYDGPGIYMYTIREKSQGEKRAVYRENYYVVSKLDKNESNRVKLSNQQFSILLYLAQRSGVEVEIDEILKNAYNTEISPESFHSQLSRLREKLSTISDDLIPPAIPGEIRGTYYKFDEQCLLQNAQKEMQPISIDKMREALSNLLFPGSSRPWQLPMKTAGIVNQSRVLERIGKLGYRYKVVSIIGNPCSGKTMFLRKFVNEHSDQVLAYFFCKWNNSDRKSPIIMMKDLAIQLILKDDDFCRQLWYSLRGLPKEELINKLSNNIIDNPQTAIEKAFDLLLAKPLSRMENPLHGYIVIDALDECDEIKCFLIQLNNLLPQIKEGTTFLLSCRKSILLKDINKQNRISINLASYSGAVKEYIHTRIPSLNDKDLDDLTKACGTNFVFARLCCDFISEGKNVLTSIKSVNMTDTYSALFPRIFKGGYTENQRRALSVILTLRTPVNADVLGMILGLNSGDIREVIESMLDILDEAAYQKQDCVTLFHKSVSDWIIKKEAALYRITMQEGATIIFDYLVHEIKTRDRKKPYVVRDNIPYSVFADWEYYGQKCFHPEYANMESDISLLLATIRQHRLHGAFGRAKQLSLKYLPYLKSGSVEWYLFNLAYCDIFFDLGDLKQAEKCLDEMSPPHNLLPANEHGIITEYYQDRAWLLMEQARGADNKTKLERFDAAQVYYDKVSRIQKSSRGSFSNNQIAHNLYVNAILHFRRRQVLSGDQQREQLIKSKDIIDKALNLLSETPHTLSEAPHTIEYSVMLKHKAWVLQEIGRYDASKLCEENRFEEADIILQKQYEEAEEVFEEAKAIQMDVFYDQPKLVLDGTTVPVSQYIAHTFKTLAENELALYRLTKKEQYIKDGLIHIDLAINVYNEYQDLRFQNQKNFCVTIQAKLNELANQ